MYIRNCYKINKISYIVKYCTINGNLQGVEHKLMLCKFKYSFMKRLYYYK